MGENLDVMLIDPCAKFTRKARLFPTAALLILGHSFLICTASPTTSWFDGAPSIIGCSVFCLEDHGYCCLFAFGAR